jgi:hypothetical protein
MSRTSLPVHKPHRIPYDEIEIAEVHLVTRFVEAERGPNRQSRTISKISFVIAQDMFQMMSDYIDELEFQTFPCPYLAKVLRVLTLCLRDAVDCVENRHARQKGMTRRVTVLVKVIPCGVHDDFQVSRQCVHVRPL